MIICQNCGTTNNENLTHTCRKCGALLPVSSKSSRSKKRKEKKNQLETLTEKSDSSTKIGEKTLHLTEIPTDAKTPLNTTELKEIPESTFEDTESEFVKSKKSESKETKEEVLQEIPAPPYRGTTIESRIGTKMTPSMPTPGSPSTDTITDAFSELKGSLTEDQKKRQLKGLSAIQSEEVEIDDSLKKRNQLEKDMTKVLSFLSKKISVKKLETEKNQTTKKKEEIKEIPPTSMNEILNRLISLDLNIEASAIIKTDGTILASAFSSKISDSLFTTIGMNLSMMGSDIMEGLGAGSLKSISLKATEGTLDLAPIDKENPSLKDMFLILFSHSKVKSGIISFAINIVKKQLKGYFGLNQ
ncbi:MAG: hypothetical protein ACFFFB_25585 [Candidatus Heimdallarchaeota archaeon]